MGQADYAEWAQVGNNRKLKYKVQWWHTDYLVLVNKGQFALGPQVEKKNVCKKLHTFKSEKLITIIKIFVEYILLCLFIFGTSSCRSGLGDKVTMHTSLCPAIPP